jgi:integrase
MGEIRRPFYTVQVTNPETGEVHREHRQSKTWQVRWYDSRGKRHEESSGSTRKGDAERLLKLREGAVAKGEPITAEMGRLRVEAALADVVRDYRINGKRTAADVERRIRLYLEPHFAGRRMASVTTADVRTYSSARLDAGAAPATVNRELAVLKRAFRLAEQAGTVLHRPHIPMLDENNVRQGFFERDEFEAVREHLPEHLRGVVTFAYLTGWRVPSEVLPLEWRQVDRRAQVVRLEPGTTKNDRGRTLPYGLLPELVEVMDAAWAEHQRLAREGTVCPYVFHRDGSPIRDFRTAWKTACKAAGVPGRIPHDLTRAGVSQTVAMQVTGHRTPSVFQRYDITTEEDVRQGLGRLAAVGAGKEKGKTTTSGKVRPFREGR